MTTYGFFSKEVAIQLEINPNTLRRWSIELEKYGYEFTRNEKDQRIYYDRDLVALTDFQKILHRTQSLENAAKVVVKRVQDQENAEKMLSVIEDNSPPSPPITDFHEEVSTLSGQVTKLVAEIADLKEFIQQQQTYIHKRLEERDRKLMESLRQSQEERQALLQIAAVQEEKKKGFFSRLFRN
jgi:DNA-binding transcriptional MerR regulator